MPFTLKIKLLYPSLMLLAFMLISLAPMRISDTGILFPAVDLMIIYYWCIYRPSLVPSGFIFIVGLLRDLISALPLGINALSNLIMRILVLYKREDFRKRSFYLIWQGFILFAAAIMLFKWIFFSFLLDEIPSIGSVFVQFLLSATAYPMIHALCNTIYLNLPKNISDA